MPLLRLLVVVGLLAAIAARGHAGDAKPLNREVMRLVAEYPGKGFGGYAWPARRGTHGTSRDLFHGTTRIARRGDGTHCVGITFEIMWRALSAIPGAHERLSTDQANRLRTLWYVPIAGGMGPAEALPAFGLGKRIVDWDYARPGDFIQLWNQDRTWGHSAVFVEWIRDDKARIRGVRYWSSQPWTDGVGFSELSIGHEPGDMDPDAVFIARLVLRAR